MPLFKIEIVETLSRIVEVEAKDEKEAYNMVEEAYKNEDIILTADDFAYYEIFEA